MLNRFRGNLDTWDPAFLGGLAAAFNVITMITAELDCQQGNVNLMFYQWRKMSRLLPRL
jgi:hypothetical protein